MLLSHLHRHPLCASLAHEPAPLPSANADTARFKLMIVGRRKPGTTLAEHRHHIRHLHGELVLRYIVTEPENAPQRYVQNQVFDGQFRATAVGNDPLALNRDFVTEIWMEDMAALTRSRATTFFLEFLKDDEDRFVDQETVIFLPVHEREVMSRQTSTNGACKLFSFIQKAPDADARQFIEVWKSGSEALRQDAIAAKIRRHVQNDVIAKPGRAPLVDGIDEFWLEDEAAARRLLPLWQAWINDTMVRAGLATESGTFALLANEAVLYAGRP